MAKAGLTYADLRALPDDAKRYELVDGTLLVTRRRVPRMGGQSWCCAASCTPTPAGAEAGYIPPPPTWSSTSATSSSPTSSTSVPST